MNEPQILASMSYYASRCVPLAASLNVLVQRLHQSQHMSCPQRAISLLVQAMRLHRRNKTVIQDCTSNLFFLTSSHYASCSKQQRNDIIMELIISIETCQDDRLILQNSLVTLFHFDIPGDVIFVFEKLAKVLLNTLLNFHNDDGIGVRAIHFCNALVCSLQHDMKEQAARVGFVPTIMKIIRIRLDQDIADEMLEVLWGTLWNVTDETPKNSWEFIRLGGI
uniref:Protein zer-1 homolog-like C-terminal domain-containing protein n=1 Tax=Ciona savignyi TaxID=51511 RepID=H2Y7G7_CIOSA